MPICPKCRGENPELGAKCPRDGYYYIYDDALDAAEQDEWIGRLAAEKYVILSLISEGGMGAVYRAMQLPVQREVAFKVLRAELQDSDQGQDRFAREARAVSKLSHPNIITMHDFGVDSKGHPFMAMEYAPGMSLANWIMQPGLKFGRISHVFRQILSALSEAHKQGIVHRDLKPENLIVTRTGADEDYIKLLDFGIARMVHDGATRGLTKEGEVFGTPHYMAPEQAQGKKDIGPPADVYALGIMLYEMLVGQCPFDAPTPLSILYMHINDDLPELEARTGISVPAEVREVIDQATAKNAVDRYQNASEMLAAFDYAIGNTQGMYVAPSGTSSEPITSTQSMGVRQADGGSYVKKATADTLNFDEESAQHITGSSNAVPIQDPEQSHSTTAALAALKPSGAQKAVVVAGVLAIVLGVGVFVFNGDDTNEVEATEQTSSATAPDDDRDGAEEAAQDSPRQRADDDQGPSDQADPSEAAEIAASKTPNPTGKAGADEGAAASDDDKDENKRESAQIKPTKKAASTDTNERKSATAGTKPSKTAATGAKTDRSAKPPKKSPPKRTDPADNTSSSAGADEETGGSDGPEKFQPKKFKPKSDSDDDEPEKFEPRKWR